MKLFKKKNDNKKFMFIMDGINVSTKDFVDAKLNGVITLRLIEEKDITVQNKDDYLYDTSLLRITPQMYKKSLGLKQDDISDIRILAGTIFETNIKELICNHNFNEFNSHKGDFTKKALKKAQEFANNEGVILDYVIQTVEMV